MWFYWEIKMISNIDYQPGERMIHRVSFEDVVGRAKQQSGRYGIPVEIQDPPRLHLENIPRYKEKRERIERWLLEKEIVDQPFINSARSLRLTDSAFDLLRQDNPGDYPALLFAYALSTEDLNGTFERIRQNWDSDLRDGYGWTENAWFAVASDFFRYSQGRWPNPDEQLDIILNQIRRPFTIYGVLKVEALGEGFDVEWAKRKIRDSYKRREADERKSS
jgi:hypothetical protein